MCIFTGHVEEVSSTNIFAADVADGKHCCVYSMKAEIAQPVAMVLPIPVAEQTEDAVEFVNLKEYSDFFKDMKKCFPEPRSRGGYLGMDFGVASSKGLEVHEVGSYIASFVPNPGAFMRLDVRFQLPRELIKAFKSYLTFGFVVFQLKEGNQEFHPMAFTYTPKNVKELFFPTVHVHDGGSYEPSAYYDHTLYVQQEVDLEFGWKKGQILPQDAMKIEKTLGLVHPTRPIRRLIVDGRIENKDYIVADTVINRSPVEAA